MSTRINVEDLVKGQFFLTNSHWYFAAARPIFGEHAVMVGIIEPMRGGYGEVVVYERTVEIAEDGEVPKPFQPASIERRAKAAEARIAKEQQNIASLRRVQATIKKVQTEVNA